MKFPGKPIRQLHCTPGATSTQQRASLQVDVEVMEDMEGPTSAHLALGTKDAFDLKPSFVRLSIPLYASSSAACSCRGARLFGDTLWEAVSNYALK